MGLGSFKRGAFFGVAVTAAVFAFGGCEAVLGVGSLTERTDDGGAADGTVGDGMAAADGAGDARIQVPDGSLDGSADAAPEAAAHVDAADDSSAADSGPDAAPCTMCNGLCTDTTQDPHNCGSCNHDCDALSHVTGAGITCNAGVCDVPPSSCAAGYAHCSSNSDDGCETDISQIANCGACGMACAAADPVCEANGSGGYGCVTGCSGATPTLCGTTCTNTSTDPNHCQTCQTACAPPLSGGGSAVCDGAQGCDIQCNIGYHQCGTEVCALDSDATQCGTTCTSCPMPTSNGGATCNAGSCGVSCGVGYHECGTTTTCAADTDATQCGASCQSCTAPENAMPTCSSGQCSFACSTNYSDCSGSCFDLQNDMNNCGTCGHSCSGTTCSSGSCQPVTLGGSTTTSLTLDATNVYFTDTHGGGSFGIYSCAKTGCNQIPSAVVSGRTSAPGALAVASNEIYWSEGALSTGDIYKCSLPSCAGGVVTITANPAILLAVDSANVFYTPYSSGKLYSCGLTSCATPSTLASSSTAPISGIYTDGVSVYFNGGSILALHQV